MPDYKLSLFKNGTRAVAVALPGLSSVTVQVLVKIGSKYEESKVFGISHFLEHMAFKGTTSRPSAQEIFREMDAKGASHNAGTSFEYTAYYIKTINENIEWALEILADIILNSVFPKEEISKEAKVIGEEIKMYQDNPMMGLSSDFMEMMYKNVGVGCWNIAGTVQGVSKIERDDLLRYRNKYLNSREMVVVVAGDVGDKEKLMAKIEEYFGSWKAKSNEKLPEVRLELSDNKKQTIYKQIEQAHFCLGFPGVSWRDESKYAARLLDIMLCGNASSVLVDLIREKHSLAYYLFPISESLAEGGFSGFQAGVTQDKLSTAIDLSLKTYLEFNEKVDEAELNRAKHYLIGKSKLNRDKTDFWSNFVGQKLLLENKLADLDEEMKNYQRVTLKDVKNFSKQYFDKKAVKILSVVSKL